MPYKGSITLFRSMTRDPLDIQPYDLGWGRLARGGVEIIEVPGDHLSIVRKDVGELASRLMAALDDVQSADEQPQAVGAAF